MNELKKQHRDIAEGATDAGAVENVAPAQEINREEFAYVDA